MSRAIAAAHAWLIVHSQELGAYAGKWVAISAAGVVATGESLKEVRGLSRRDEVIVFKLPKEVRKRA